MKNEFNLSFLLNPFERIAGVRALLIGLVIFFVSTLLAQSSDIVFSGVIGVQIAPVSISQAFVIHGISTVILILMMYITGLISSSTSIRFIDVAGTMVLSRAPFLLISIFVGLPFINNSWKRIGLAMIDADMITLSIFALSTLVVIFGIIWFVVLAYNAFSVSCNMKGMKSGIVFTVSLLLSFVISTLIILKIYSVDIIPAVPENNPHTNELVSQADFSEINAIAKQAALDIYNGKYEDVIVHFDDKMKEVLPVDKLKEVIQTMESRFGKMVNIEDDIKNTQVSGNNIVMVPVAFEKMSLYFRFTFNENNQISGFYM